jgi:hypothetical protein
VLESLLESSMHLTWIVDSHYCWLLQQKEHQLVADWLQDVKHTGHHIRSELYPHYIYLHRLNSMYAWLMTVGSLAIALQRTFIMHWRLTTQHHIVSQTVPRAKRTGAFNLLVRFCSWTKAGMASFSDVLGVSSWKATLPSDVMHVNVAT